MTERTGEARSEKGKSAGFLIGAGVAIFIVCAIIQAACGSSMFSQSYMDDGSLIKELIINVTWWPGWLMSVGFVAGGVLEMVKSK